MNNIHQKLKDNLDNDYNWVSVDSNAESVLDSNLKSNLIDFYGNLIQTCLNGVLLQAAQVNQKR